MSLGVESCPGATVDEDKPGTEHVAAPISIRPDWGDLATAEVVVDFACPAHHPGTLMWCEVNGPCNDERVLVFLPKLSPVVHVGEDVFVRFEVFLAHHFVYFRVRIVCGRLVGSTRSRCLAFGAGFPSGGALAFGDADEIEHILVHKFTRFLTQRAEAFFILRRKPIKVR